MTITMWRIAAVASLMLAYLCAYMMRYEIAGGSSWGVFVLDRWNGTVSVCEPRGLEHSVCGAVFPSNPYPAPSASPAKLFGHVRPLGKLPEG